jgi:hypothetical protein
VRKAINIWDLTATISQGKMYMKNYTQRGASKAKVEKYSEPLHVSLIAYESWVQVRQHIG